MNLDRLITLKASFDAAIDLSRKKNRLLQNGISPKEFITLHTDPDCNIQPKLIEVLYGKGAIHLDTDSVYDYTAPAYRYKDECRKHGVASATYDLDTLQ